MSLFSQVQKQSLVLLEQDFVTEKHIRGETHSLTVGSVADVCFKRLANINRNYSEVAISIADLFFHRGLAKSGYAVTWTDFLEHASANPFVENGGDGSSSVKAKEAFPNFQASSIIDTSGVNGDILDCKSHQNHLMLCEELSRGVRMFNCESGSMVLHKTLPLPPTLSNDACTRMCWNPTDFSVGAILRRPAFCVWDIRGTISTCRVKNVISTAEVNSGIWASSLFGSKYVTCFYESCDLALFDSNTGLQTHRLSGHSKIATSLVDCSKLVASASLDKTIIMWDPVTMKRVLTLRDSMLGINCLMYADSHGVLLSGGADGKIRINYEDSKYLINTLRDHTSPITAIERLPNSPNYFLTSDESEVVKIWDARNWSCFQTIQPDTNANFRFATTAGEYIVKVGRNRLGYLEPKKQYATTSAQVRKSVMAIHFNFCRLYMFVATESSVDGYCLIDGRLRCSWALLGLRLLSQEHSEQRQLAVFLEAGDILILDCFSGNVLRKADASFRGRRRLVAFDFVKSDCLLTLSSDGSMSLILEGVITRSILLSPNPVKLLRSGELLTVFYANGLVCTVTMTRSSFSATDVVESAVSNITLSCLCGVTLNEIAAASADNFLSRLSLNGSLILRKPLYTKGVVTAICYYHKDAKNVHIELTDAEQDMLSSSERYLLSDSALESIFLAMLDHNKLQIVKHETLHGKREESIESPRPREITFETSTASAVLIVGDDKGNVYVIDPVSLDATSSWHTQAGCIESLKVIRGVEGVLSLHSDMRVKLWSFRYQNLWSTIDLSCHPPKSLGYEFPLINGHPVMRIIARRIAQLALPESEVTIAFETKQSRLKNLVKSFHAKRSIVERLSQPLEKVSEKKPEEKQELKQLTTPRSLRQGFLKQELIVPILSSPIKPPKAGGSISELEKTLNAMDKAFFTRLPTEHSSRKTRYRISK